MRGMGTKRHVSGVGQNNRGIKTMNERTQYEQDIACDRKMKATIKAGIVGVTPRLLAEAYCERYVSAYEHNDTVNGNVLAVRQLEAAARIARKIANKSLQD